MKNEISKDADLHEIYLAGGVVSEVEGIFLTRSRGDGCRFQAMQVVGETTKYELIIQMGHAETVSPMMPSKFLSRKSCFTISTYQSTSKNKQGNDVAGTQYRTGVYYTDDKDLEVINQVFDELAKKYDQPLAVRKGKLENFG